MLPFVDPSRYSAPDWGRAVSTGGSYPYVAYVPAPLPLALPLEPRTVSALSTADLALGRLAGAGRLLPNPHLFVMPSLVQEALSSSRMEGTQASLSEVFDATAAGTPARGDVREVQNYVRALEHGLQRLGELPISKRLLCEMHAILLDGVRGDEKTPGEFRRSQNWIGGSNVASALFVPPTADNMWPALDDWEKYVHHERPELPVLIRSALLHYQFETIHPFLDGNGQLGRLFLVLFLSEQGVLPAPLLPLSAELERDKPGYIGALQGVRETGDIQSWLRFFLDAVARQAMASVERADRLTDHREYCREQLRGTRSRAAEVVDLMFGNPVLTVHYVASALQVTPQGAVGLLRLLTKRGILREDSSGRGVRARWYADQVLSAIGD
jgi:Fic family protein